MFYNNVEDECWDIKDIIKRNLLNEDDEEKETFMLTKEEAHNILNKLKDIEDEYDDMVSDLEAKDEEITDLENKVEDLEYYDDVPEELARLLSRSDFDVGTVIELQEAITKVLKDRGYSVC